MTQTKRDRNVELLRELVEIESPTYSPGVRRVGEVIARELDALGARTRFVDDDHLIADLDGHGEPLFVCGHADTVWPEGTLETMPFRIDGDRAYGPGAYDMKACLVLMLDAIARAGSERRALRVFVTADEEMGSRTARPHLEREAKECAAALIVEPPGATGNLKTARKGLGRFRITIRGRPAHAGTNPGEGASAIEELAHQILALQALNDDGRGISVNVGVVHGGTSENVVPARAEAQIDVRVRTFADRERMEQVLSRLQRRNPETTIELGGGWTRPPLEESEGARKLFAQARAHARELGLELEAESSGGGSDGNLVGAAGVPVLDGLGAEGSGAHARDEHVLLPSIPLRAELLSRLLRRPGV